jgi:hypothetical protein
MSTPPSSKRAMTLAQGGRAAAALLGLATLASFATLDLGCTGKFTEAEGGPPRADGGSNPDASTSLIDWTDCGASGAIAGVSTAAFCDAYFTTDCPMGEIKFADRAACLERHGAFNPDQQSCAAFNLCKAKTTPDLCRAVVEAGGPCNLP